MSSKELRTQLWEQPHHYHELTTSAFVFPNSLSLVLRLVVYSMVCIGAALVTVMCIYNWVLSTTDITMTAPANWKECLMIVDIPATSGKTALTTTPFASTASSYAQHLLALLFVVCGVIGIGTLNPHYLAEGIVLCFMCVLNGVLPFRLSTVSQLGLPDSMIEPSLVSLQVFIKSDMYAHVDRNDVCDGAFSLNVSFLTLCFAGVFAMFALCLVGVVWLNVVARAETESVGGSKPYVKTSTVFVIMQAISFVVVLIARARASVEILDAHKQGQFPFNPSTTMEATTIILCASICAHTHARLHTRWWTLGQSQSRSPSSPSSSVFISANNPNDHHHRGHHNSSSSSNNVFSLAQNGRGLPTDVAIHFIALSGFLSVVLCVFLVPCVVGVFGRWVGGDGFSGDGIAAGVGCLGVVVLWCVSLCCGVVSVLCWHANKRTRVVLANPTHS